MVWCHGMNSTMRWAGLLGGSLQQDHRVSEEPPRVMTRSALTSCVSLQEAGRHTPVLYMVVAATVSTLGGAHGSTQGVAKCPHNVPKVGNSQRFYEITWAPRGQPRTSVAEKYCTQSHARDGVTGICSRVVVGLSARDEGEGWPGGRLGPKTYSQAVHTVGLDGGVSASPSPPHYFMVINSRKWNRGRRWQW